MDENIATKADSTRSKIVRALLCAAGKHEAWEQKNVWNGRTNTVHVYVESSEHDDVHCCVCKHCRTIYVRRRDE